MSNWQLLASDSIRSVTWQCTSCLLRSQLCVFSLCIFSRDQEFLWLYGRPWAQQGTGRGGCSGTTPHLTCAPARPSHPSCCASTGRTHELGSAALSQLCHLSRRWPGCPSEQSSCVPCCSCPSGSPDSGSPDSGSPLPIPCPGARFVKVLYPPFDFSLVSQAGFTLEPQLPQLRMGCVFSPGPALEP